ncbi:PLP-dependent transferase [Leucogyrophana mollusca]|uniref:PLP-dependent transferase n=1 Tax=Leucogyrophana mollusca TaxID=85980 RepID=A0ACB8B8H8_9AGAM|nr:PLP-dependent transferase [Leucogyrophana mollusca]
MATHSDGILIAPNGNGHVNGNAKAPSSAVKQLPEEFYRDFLSIDAKTRKPSPIRGLFPLENRPGVISLLAGKPNDAMFPFTSFNFMVKSPTDTSKEIPVTLDGADLALGLQYGATAGLPRLVEWFTGLQELSHKRKKGEGWRLSVGGGSQDMLYKAVTAIVNPGDPVLVESPVYAGVLPMFETLHCEQIEVETDAEGIRSESLRSILENWPASKPKPKVLYTVPYGCNPTGMTASTPRRKEVLELARVHNFIILEDDPYYYLYFGKAERPPSYFQLELDEPEVGRVLRFDSLSKILSAGMRIGFASGPKPFLDAIDLHTGTANLQGSHLTQAITLALLEKWGYDNFITHTHNVAAFYKQKRDVFEKALSTHLAGLAEWSTPEAGMFVWFKLLMNPVGDVSAEGDSEDLIRTKAYEGGVLALPGTVFLPDGRKTAYVRASFSLSTEEQVNEALKRLRTVILKERGAL